MLSAPGVFCLEKLSVTKLFTKSGSAELNHDLGCQDMLHFGDVALDSDDESSWCDILLRDRQNCVLPIRLWFRRVTRALCHRFIFTYDRPTSFVVFGTRDSHEPAVLKLCSERERDNSCVPIQLHRDLESKAICQKEVQIMQFSKLLCD